MWHSGAVSDADEQEIRRPNAAPDNTARSLRLGQEAGRHEQKQTYSPFSHVNIVQIRRVLSRESSGGISALKTP